MNIQQLNSSGQSIKTFIMTAVVMLLLTGGSWLCIEEINGYYSWLRRPKRSTPVQALTRQTYNITVRVAMLVWLYRNGHWSWVRTTTAWWYILADTRPIPDEGFGQRLEYWVSWGDRQLSAGGYVSRYMCTSHASHAFRLGRKDDEERAS